MNEHNQQESVSFPFPKFMLYLFLRPITLSHIMKQIFQPKNSCSSYSFFFHLAHNKTIQKLLIFQSSFYVTFLFAVFVYQRQLLDIGFISVTFILFLGAFLLTPLHLSTKGHHSISDAIAIFLTLAIAPFVCLPALFSGVLALKYALTGKSSQATFAGMCTAFFLGLAVSHLTFTYDRFKNGISFVRKAQLTRLPMLLILIGFTIALTQGQSASPRTILLAIGVFIVFLEYLQIPLWGMSQLWIVFQHKVLEKQISVTLSLEASLLPELLLATRLLTSMKLEPQNTKPILWVTKFHMQRWAARKAIILLWEESPNKVVLLFEQIRANKYWQAPVSVDEDTVLARSVEPICWEEVLLCELFGVQVDKQLLRWYERIMFAPERWLRKSKTLYPPCPQDLQELALELVQPLMAQGEQAVETKFEAQTKPEST